MHFLRFAAFALPVLALASSISTRAEASACSGTQAEISNIEIDVPAELSCLSVEVGAPGCGDEDAVILTNHCDSDVTLPPGACRDDCNLEPGESINVFPNDEDGAIDESWTVGLDGVDHDVHVSYDVEYVGGEGESGGGCSAAASPATGGAGSVAALVAAAAALARIGGRRRAGSRANGRS